MQTHPFAAGSLTARVSAHGAELTSLATAGHELLWQAGPAWKRHAPLLFPIVGRLANDTLRHEGKTYTLPQHGFARDLQWQWLARAPTGCTLVLQDTPETLACYPFRFRLEAEYRLHDEALSLTFRLSNPAETPLLASLGTHTAFNWPLLPALAPQAHQIRFDHPEPAPIRRLTDGLLMPDPVPTPVHGTILPLTEALFAHDALVFPHPTSRAATLEVPGGPAVRMEWEGFPQLGIWSKPAPFVCIEPWAGHADPQGYTGDFASKPGILYIASGAERRFEIKVTARHDGAI